MRLAIILSLGLTALPAYAQNTPSGDETASPAAEPEGEAWRLMSDGRQLRADDTARLEQLNIGVGDSLLAALAGADDADRAVLVDGLSGTALPPDQARPLLQGEWGCRTVKVGLGTLPIVVYPEFRCRIDAQGHFEKLTGSQRSSGDIADWQGQLIYAGTGFVQGETPIAYAEQCEDVDTSRTPQMMPQVGRVEITSPETGRILFPRPYLESQLDLLILRR
ncbi:DUF4893 domain-containing protein [Paracoccus sp. TK19116]|uniref:DUF4893 domain-containing protein n=1 Tax=Paracoccus albicereus TaxID=2922394 RepID=A0ABT1MSQ1_9RHOB|nr:DUF4893 domain-containing protein [Paracoccus albicereus]MCQ0970759.1 DUF4893 domain-containing protein [Paracoccus albicereus]